VFGYRSRCSVALFMEPSFDSVLRAAPPSGMPDLIKQIQQGKDAKYLVYPGRFQAHRRWWQQRTTVVVADEGRSSVALWFFNDASPPDILKGLFHSAVVRRLLSQRQQTSHGEPLFDPATDGVATTRFVEHSFQQFSSQLEQAGWTLTHLFLAEDHQRLEVQLDDQQQVVKTVVQK